MKISIFSKVLFRFGTLSEIDILEKIWHFFIYWGPDTFVLKCKIISILSLSNESFVSNGQHQWKDNTWVTNKSGVGGNIRQITMPLRQKKKFLTFAIEWEIIIEQWGFDSTTTLLCEEQKRQKMFSWESHICYYTLVSIRKILEIRRRCTGLPTLKSFERQHKT